MSQTISGTYASGVTLSGNPATIATGTTISGTANYAVGVYGAGGTDWTLTNEGLVSATGTHSDGVYFAANGTIINTGFGTIYGSRFGVYLRAGGAVTNRSGGTISGDQGIFGASADAVTVVNAGGITGGVNLPGGGSVTNQSGGTISGNGGSAGVSAGIHTVTVVNAGSIAGGVDLATVYQGSSVTNQSGGVISGNDAIYGNYSVSTVENAGTIAGNTNDGVGVDLIAGGNVTNQSGGVISGWEGIYGGRSPPRPGGGVLALVNAGTIAGVASGISMRAGGYVINQSGATISGYVAIVARFEVGGGGGGVVVNAGTIMGNMTSRYGAGVVLGIGGVTNQSGGTISGYDGIVGGGFDYPVTVENAGTIIGSRYAVQLESDVAPAGFGLRLIVDPGAVFIGGVNGGGGVLELASAASAGTLSGSFSNFSTLQFDAGAAWTISGGAESAAPAISGFADGDTIDQAGFVAQSAIFANNTLVLTDAAGHQATLNILGGFAQDAFQISNDGDGGTDIVVCFCTGTQIGTPTGEVPVEKLQTGDLVLTAHNGPRAVKWIGHGKALATRGRRGAATPVIVRKGALAGNVPNQDLRVTKAHALYIDNALIPVEFLVNHKTILWDDRAQEVAIYHVELESHDVLIANGAPAESFRDDGNRWLFQNARLGGHLTRQDPYAPVLTGGPVVDAAWRRLLDRAGPRNLPPLTDDPDLHLVVDGARVDAGEQRGSVYVFRLPPSPRSVVIASRSVVPAELGIARDSRSLGVALRRVAVRQGARFTLFNAGDKRLATGFHDYEADSDLRWTDGHAELPSEAFAPFNAGAELMLHLGGATRYPDDRGSAARTAA